MKPTPCRLWSWSNEREKFMSEINSVSWWAISQCAIWFMHSDPSHSHSDAAWWWRHWCVAREIRIWHFHCASSAVWLFNSFHGVFESNYSPRYSIIPNIIVWICIQLAVELAIITLYIYWCCVVRCFDFITLHSRRHELFFSSLHIQKLQHNKRFYSSASSFHISKTSWVWNGAVRWNPSLDRAQERQGNER